jgi:hypothetical protein
MAPAVSIQGVAAPSCPGVRVQTWLVHTRGVPSRGCRLVKCGDAVRWFNILGARFFGSVFSEIEDHGFAFPSFQDGRGSWAHALVIPRSASSSVSCTIRRHIGRVLKTFISIYLFACQLKIELFLFSSSSCTGRDGVEEAGHADGAGLLTRRVLLKRREKSSYDGHGRNHCP